ncbi:hypothetical protein ACKLNO_00505 [Neisseriaceae bacterium B1]
MNKHLPLAILTAMVLSACGTLEVPRVLTPNNNTQSSGVYQLDRNHWTDVAKIRAEAQRLGTQVSSGKITKVQAAQMLDRYRRNLVGRNSVDDSVYEVYQQAAVDSQRGAINASQSKAYVENALRGWQQRWPNMSNKPANPAFTNFLLEYMGMKPLQ